MRALFLRAVLAVTLLAPSLALALDPTKTPPITSREITTNRLTLPSTADPLSRGDLSPFSVTRSASAPAGSTARQFSDMFESVPLTPKQAPFGAKGDGQVSYPVYSTTAGSKTVNFQSCEFSTADVGKLIELRFAGAGAAHLFTKIDSVSTCQQIVVHDAASTNLASVNHQVFRGTDDTAALQAMMTAATSQSRSWRITPGMYMTTSTLFARAGAFDNVLDRAPPSWSADGQAEIRAMAPMSALIRYGDIDGYSQYLHNAVISGGIWNANFLATDAIQFPWVKHGSSVGVTVKNIVNTGWRMGSAAAPKASAGHNFYYVDITRDTLRIPVASISKGSPALVTTAHPHGLASGRVVSFPILSGMGQLAQRYVDITVTGPTTFQLRGGDSTNYDAFGSGFVAAGMPSARIARTITSISQGNPATVTTSGPHYLTSGANALLSDFGGMTEAQGIFPVTVTGANSFTIPVNTGSSAPYFGNGHAVEWVDTPNQQIGIYDEYHTDAFQVGGAWQGISIGRSSNPALSSGFDGKYIGTHVFNSEDGELLTALRIGGDNHISNFQIDGPFKFAAMLYGPRNTADGFKVNYDPTLQIIDDYASAFYLTTGRGLYTGAAELNSTNGGFKGGTDSIRLHSDAEGNISAYTGNSNIYIYVINPRTPRQVWIDSQAGTFTISGGVATVQPQVTNIAFVTVASPGDLRINSNLPLPTSAGIMAVAVSGPGAGEVWNCTEYAADRTAFMHRILCKYWDTTQTPAVWKPANPPEVTVRTRGLQ